MTIKERIESIKERIEKAALRSGRNPSDIILMGISKFHTIKAIEAALKEGLFLFGESRVQEAEKKIPVLREAYPQLEFHMVGHLQRNKVKTALKLFNGIQSLDRDEVITALGNAAGSQDQLGWTVLLEMHTGEESKTGYPDADSLSHAAELVLSFPQLRLSGLMTMAPFTQDFAVLRTSFKKLAAARDILQRRFPNSGFSCLSMGMTNDFETAIEEGSTLIRIGTAIFGEPYGGAV